MLKCDNLEPASHRPFTRIRATILSLLLLLAGSARGVVVLDSNSDITITNAGPAGAELELASGLLERYLTRALEKTQLEGDGNAVRFVLEADALVWSALPAEKSHHLSDLDAYTIEIRRGGPPTIRIHGSTVLATSFGVMDFLEHDLGITWLFPGELGLALPDRKRTALKEGSRRVAPAITSRLYTGMLYGDRNQMQSFRKSYSQTPLHNERHFFEAHDYFKSLRLHFLASPSHNMINIFPGEDLKRHHPDWLPLQEDGTRYQPPDRDPEQGNRHQHWHPCYTNPEVVARAVERAREAFADGQLCFSLGINDGLRVQCQCENCRRVGWPQSYYQFVTKVAEAVHDQYPPHLLGVLVYGDVRHPSADLRLPDNVLTMITGSSKFEEWSRHAKHLGRYGYFYGSGFFVPNFPLRSMLHNARIFERYGVRSFRAEAYPVWAFDGPKIYLQSKLLWNPRLNTDAALARYCNAAFGRAGPSMRKFYLRWASLGNYLAEHKRNEPAPLCNMSRWRNPDAQFAPVSPRDFAYARAHLQKARRIVRGTMETKRLEMVGTWFDLSDAMCQIYHTVQGIYAHDHRRRRDINAVFEELQAQNQRIERLQEEIDAHEEWGIGTKETDRSGESNVNKAARSGLLTALMDLRQAAKLDSSTGKSLPDFLKPYALDNMRVSPADHIKVMDRGTYYALERTRNRFEPMEVTSQANRLFANATSENPLVTEGSLAGEFKKHWAYALVDYDEKATGRVLYQITLKSKARDGTLELTLSNPWVAEDEDGLPVGTSLVFERRATTQTRTLVIEPVSIESGRHGSNFLYRLTMLWTPESDSASCESTVEITKIILSDANDDR